jgi:curved DNA-binding protein CbpA
VRRDYYALLDVRREASPAEIKRAYETALNRASRDGATRHMVDLVKAYEVLSHAGRRQVYDETGIGVVPERVPNTYGRAVAFRGGHMGLGVRRRSAAPSATVLPSHGRLGGPSRSMLIALSLIAVITLSLVGLVALGAG